ncbi:23S rRNA (uracil(1939)-C(5))-methyltransferase RlmD [Schnuerera sp. xch1]|uniref:23S rRNA (uracil(1939)-C(5))-methyltransferase RlmD n=1 Tax=Schnuerera sp. xch1 TaxID=2874283 RepID=UPI001CBC5A59|nr:23S rRNA (uracil(1939)-C(5))-methyltransferase RlmD [Schnuerera sp. xch1]
MNFRIGDRIRSEIIDINNKGMGVGRYQGFTFFIEGCTLGDKVLFEIVKLKKRFGIGKTLEILDESPYRVEPKCEYSAQCDGCELHNLKYEKQLELKKDIVKNNLKRIGKIKNVPVRDTIGMDYPYRYRNKGEFKVGKNFEIGYFKRETHDIYPVEKSIIQKETVDVIIELIKEYMKKYKVEGYDRKTKRGVIKNLIIRTTKDNNVMVIIVTKDEKLPHKDELRTVLFSSHINVVSIYQNINNKDTSVVLGSKYIKLFGENKIIDYIGEYKFLISPKSFFQVNPVQTEVLYDKVVEYLDPKGEEIVADLYCGIGTISLYISRYVKKVYGVEIVKEAIEDAKENTKLNRIKNVEFVLGKSEEILPKLIGKGIKLDSIIVDPPRKGLDRSLVDSIIEANPQKIVYVSCNPSTLARDLGYLVEEGYKVVEVQPVDMFPHTAHVESIILMTYCGSEEKK